MQNPVIIGFDLDDVLFDLMGPMVPWHNERYGTSLTRDEYFTFDLDKVWNCTGDEAWDRVCNYYQSEHYKNSLPVEGALEGMKKLNEKYQCVIITARPESQETMVREWLDLHLPKVFDEVVFTNHFNKDGVKRTKSSVCLELGVKLFVEDAIHNAEDVAGAGIPVLLMDTPWNRVELPPLVTRVTSWNEIVEKINEL